MTYPPTKQVVTSSPAKAKKVPGTFFDVFLVILSLLIAYGHAAASAADADRARAADRQRRLISIYVRKSMEAARKYAVQESAVPPAWAADEGQPLWRFVQVTDIHYRESLRDPLIRALDFISRDLRPAFVVFTGDTPGSSKVSAQRAFKAIVDEHLNMPRFYLRGDNWPDGFTEVFGDANWSFRCGGTAFIGASVDRDVPAGDGIGVFEDDTVLWIAGRLAENRNCPVIYFQHMNLLPPTFLDAPRLLKLFESSGPSTPLRAAGPVGGPTTRIASNGGNVVATITGHLHLDYETRQAGIAHLIGPAFGADPERPFKVYEVHENHITARTAMLRDGAYRLVKAWQRIDFPAGVRLAPASKEDDGGTLPPISDYDAPPRREIVRDATLANRMPELVPQLVAFVLRTGRSLEILGDLLSISAEVAAEIDGRPAPAPTTRPVGAR